MAKKKILKTPRRNVGDELIAARNELTHLKGVMDAEREAFRLATQEWREHEAYSERQIDEQGERLADADKLIRRSMGRLEAAAHLLEEKDLNISVLLQEVFRLRQEMTTMR